MKAMVLHEQARIETRPLLMEDVPEPCASPGRVRLRVTACGICHTDLHVVEGDLEPHKMPVIPGHQIVGQIDEVGEGVQRFHKGERVGIPWLHETCGKCEFCTMDRENLCEEARFTGYDVDGGFSQLVTVPEAFSYRIPDGFSDLDAAPLLCAGIIGYRALRLSEARPGCRLGLIGFGASAHVTIQVAIHQGMEVYVLTRSQGHRRLAEELGAAWTGTPDQVPPVKLDSAIIFAPAGELVPVTLKRMKKGGTIALGGIHMTRIPPIEYVDWWGERTIRSVANSTRADAEGLLEAAAEIPIRTHVQTFPLDQANEALIALKESRIDGAGVLIPDEQ
jgi:propanol-preferring alcohol dehydrogenase